MDKPTVTLQRHKLRPSSLPENPVEVVLSLSIQLISIGIAGYGNPAYVRPECEFLTFRVAPWAVDELRMTSYGERVSSRWNSALCHG